MTPLDAFSADYFVARSRFREALRQRGWMFETHPIASADQPTLDLSIDVARLGADNASRALVITSGVHGPEGLFGSAAQLMWLESLPVGWRPPADQTIVLIHAVNPYGFAFLRRANEENVDLNRNFLPEESFEKLRERTEIEFGPLDPWLNPPGPPSRIDLFALMFPWMALRFGVKKLREVMPAGQFAFPKGIFYGGATQARSTRVVMTEMPRWLGDARSVVHLDFHTGLGRYGHYKLLASEPPGSHHVVEASRFFGDDRVVVDWQADGGYHNHGDFGDWLAGRFPERDYLYLCAEFGTFGPTRVIGTMRRENQFHHGTDPTSPARQAFKARVLDTFCPVSPSWRSSVVRQAHDLIQNSLIFCSKRGTN